MIAGSVLVVMGGLPSGAKSSLDPLCGGHDGASSPKILEKKSHRVMDEFVPWHRQIAFSG